MQILEFRIRRMIYAEIPALIFEAILASVSYAVPRIVAMKRQVKSDLVVDFGLQFALFSLCEIYT